MNRLAARLMVNRLQEPISAVLHDVPSEEHVRVMSDLIERSRRFLTEMSLDDRPVNPVPILEAAHPGDYRRFIENARRIQGITTPQDDVLADVALPNHDFEPAVTPGNFHQVNLREIAFPHDLFQNKDERRDAVATYFLGKIYQRCTPKDKAWLANKIIANLGGPGSTKAKLRALVGRKPPRRGI